MLWGEPEESRKIRGDILAETTDIEKYLTKFLAEYLSEDTQKREELHDFIFNTELFGFKKKIELFKKLSKKLYGKNDEDMVEKLIEAFIFINEVRNKVAHWGWSQSKTREGDYYLQNPRKKEEVLKLDKKLLNKYHKCVMETLRFFGGWDERF